MRTLIVIAVLACLAPSRAPAQSLQLDSTLRAAAALQLAARRATPPLPRPSASTELAALATRHQRSTGKTLMLIGGGVVLAGLLVGDGGGTFLVVGGVVTAGYGFLLYEQQ